MFYWCENACCLVHISVCMRFFKLYVALTNHLNIFAIKKFKKFCSISVKYDKRAFEDFSAEGGY